MTNLDMNSPKTQDLLRKIRALKAKADDKSTTEAESLAFAAKVAQLLAEYGLEQAQLDVGTQEETPIGHEDYVSNWNSSPARRVLAMAVCKLYNVKPLIRSAPGQPWTLVGRKHNIVMVKDMTAYLIKTTLRLSNDFGKTTPGGNVIDFRRGCFKRLAERLYEMYDQIAQAEAPKYTATNNPGNLPALYMSERKQLNAYVDSRWKTGTLRPQRIRQGYSAMAGRSAANTISLNQQLNGGRSNHLIGKK